MWVGRRGSRSECCALSPIPSPVGSCHSHTHHGCGRLINAKQPIHCSFHLNKPLEQGGGRHCGGKDSKPPSRVPWFCRGAITESSCLQLHCRRQQEGREGGWRPCWAHGGERDTEETPVGTCHLVPGGPRQGSLWSRNMSLIQEGGEGARARVYVCMEVVWLRPCFILPSTDSPTDSELSHIRVCIHSSVGPDRGLGKGRVLSAPVSTP